MVSPDISDSDQPSLNRSDSSKLKKDQLEKTKDEKLNLNQGELSLKSAVVGPGKSEDIDIYLSTKESIEGHADTEK